MSLITLQSTSNSQTPSNTDPAIIRNNFKDGIELKKGTEVGLVSLSINKIASFQITQGENDTFTWRIGGIGQFSQHTVVIPEGQYTGEGLAIAMVEQLNASTILGNFKGAWTATFDPDGFDKDGSFTIDYGQNITPDFNDNTLSLYSGNAGQTFFNNGTNEITAIGHKGTANFVDRTPVPQIITGNKGIFPNEGEVSYTLIPVQGYPFSSIEDRLITQGGNFTENDDGTVRTFTIAVPAGGSDAETNGWTYVVSFTNGDADEYWYFDDSTEGKFGIGYDATVAGDDPSNWDDEIYYNPDSGTFRNVPAGGRDGNNGQDTGLVISGDPENTSLAIQKVNMGYGATIMGYVRDQLYHGRDKYPANPEALIKSTINDGVECGFDIMFKITDNANFDGIEVQLGQMLQNNNIPFPNAGWRSPSKSVYTKTPSNWSSIAGTNPAPTDWASFNYGQDHIQVKVSTIKITNMSISISHDAGGNGVWSELTTLSIMGQGGNNISPNIKEEHYSLRPVLCMANGGWYDSKQVKVSGKFDTDEIVRQGVDTVYSGVDIDENDPDFISNDDIEVDAPTNAVKLSALYLFGPILSSDLTSNGGDLPDAEVPSPASRLVNNIDSLIGMERFYQYKAGLVSNPTQSSHRPTLITREANLLIELVDFNIKGYNGATGDMGKIIASIPAEELNTNTRTGTLNYFSHYPIMIDLNLVNDTIIYDMNVIIRRPNGQIADDLIPTTNLTLIIKEGEESKQKRMMKEQAELIASSLSNMQQIKTDSVGTGYPML